MAGTLGPGTLCSSKQQQQEGGPDAVPEALAAGLLPAGCRSGSSSAAATARHCQRRLRSLLLCCRLYCCLAIRWHIQSGRYAQWVQVADHESRCRARLPNVQSDPQPAKGADEVVDSKCYCYIDVVLVVGFLVKVMILHEAMILHAQDHWRTSVCRRGLPSENGV